MNRTLMLALVAAALLLAAGAALAKDIACTGGGECRGTEQADAITGTPGDDRILGLAGNDALVGDLARVGGDDVIRGGAGDDNITDLAPGDADAVFGGKGNDTIDVEESNGQIAGGADVVDCGDGKDTVFLNPDDTAKNCERKNPGDGIYPP